MELIKDEKFYRDCLKDIHINEGFDFKNKIKRYNTFEDYLRDIHILIRCNNINYKQLYERLLQRYYIDYLNGPLNLYEGFTQYDLYDLKHNVFDYTYYVYNELNGIVYYITKKKHVDKIIKYGLCPTPSYNDYIHSDIIYVLSELPISSYMLFVKDLNNIENDIYCLLKIELKQHMLYLHNQTKLKFLNDPNVSIGSNDIPVAFYTCENISPNCIEYFCDL